MKVLSERDGKYTLAHYAGICSMIVAYGYQTAFFDEVAGLAEEERVVLLRHDIDQLLEQALRMARRYESIEPARDFVVLCPATVRHPLDSSVMSFKTPPVAHVNVLAGLKDCVLLVPEDDEGTSLALRASHLVLRVGNPRLEFARLVEFALAQVRDNRVYRTLENGAVVGQDVTLGEGVVIEPLAFLDHDVTIGDRTIIFLIDSPLRASL